MHYAEQQQAPTVDPSYYANAKQAAGVTAQIKPRHVTATEELADSLRETVAILSQAQNHLDVLDGRLFAPAPCDPGCGTASIEPHWTMGVLMDVARQLRSQALSLRSSAESLNERI